MQKLQKKILPEAWLLTLPVKRHLVAILSCLPHTHMPIEFVGGKKASGMKEGYKWKMALSRYCAIHTSLLIWRSCSIAE